MIKYDKILSVFTSVFLFALSIHKCVYIYMYVGGWMVLNATIQVGIMKCVQGRRVKKCPQKRHFKESPIFVHQNFHHCENNEK